MKELINSLIKFYNELLEEIKRYEKSLLFIKILDNKEIEKKILILPYLQTTINQSLQLGNYRRAFKFIVLLDSIVKELQEINKQISEKMTELLV